MDDAINNTIAAMVDGGADDRLRLVAKHGDALAGATLDDAQRAALQKAMLEVLESGYGSGKRRVHAGVLLGRIGDPRLRTPSSEDYWARLTLKSGDVVEIAKHQVTNHEYSAWVAAGGYDDDAVWSDAGKAWRDGCNNPWPVLAGGAEDDRLLVANQPVVGVTWFEAEAYATAHGARLPRWYERVFAVRGFEKRPYPWGSPFGENNANTKEEVLGRPCAVGLYVNDRTPQGICDLAGNVGEWTAERAEGDELLLHPGSWEQPSLAAWAKALTTEAPTARGPGLGFRLVRG